LQLVATVARAHFQLPNRISLVLQLLRLLEGPLAPLFSTGLTTEPLRQLTSLQHKEYAAVALKARQLLVRQQTPSQSSRFIAMEAILKSVAHATSVEERIARSAPLVEQTQDVTDLIFNFLQHRTPALRSAALEIYIRRAFQMYRIVSLETRLPSAKTASTDVAVAARWTFVNEDATVDNEDDHVAPKSAVAATTSPNRRSTAARKSLMRSVVRVTTGPAACSRRPLTERAQDSVGNLQLLERVPQPAAAAAGGSDDKAPTPGVTPSSSGGSSMWSFLRKVEVKTPSAKSEQVSKAQVRMPAR
jgi:hypothetical protein